MCFFVPIGRCGGHWGVKIGGGRGAQVCMGKTGGIVDWEGEDHFILLVPPYFLLGKGVRGWALIMLYLDLFNFLYF